MNTQAVLASAPHSGSTQPSRLRAQLVEFRTKHSIPALGAAIVTRDDHLDLDVIGVRVRGGDDPVQRDDRWHIGSCGKSTTAALYARLVERGDAKWGAPLPDLFPDLTDATDPGWRAITINDLFVSQAGLPANLSRAELSATLPDTRPLPEQRTAVAAAAMAGPQRPLLALIHNRLTMDRPQPVATDRNGFSPVEPFSRPFHLPTVPPVATARLH